MAGLARAALLAAATVAASPPIRVAVVVRLGLWLGLALGQVRVMVRVRVSSVPPRREHSGVPLHRAGRGWNGCLLGDQRPNVGLRNKRDTPTWSPQSTCFAVQVALRAG